MVLRYNSLIKYDGLSHEHACLHRAAGRGGHFRAARRDSLGRKRGVLGPGPLGLMAARVARIRGRRAGRYDGPIVRYAPRPARRELAAKFGCDEFIETGKQDVEAEIKRKFSAGVNRVIVSSPPESLMDALKIIKYGGIITFFGLHFGGRSKIEINVNNLVFRKITLVPTFAEPAINFPLSNRLLRDGLVNASLLVSHTFGFDQAKETMRAIIDGTQPIIKAVMVAK